MNKFKQDDRILSNVKEGVAAVKYTNILLNKYGKITPKLPITFPHTLFYGPGGTGKTCRAEAAAEILGCNEESNTFIRINADCIKDIEDLVYLLQEKLSWRGYLCSNGQVCTTDKPAGGLQIVDPVNPRRNVQQAVVFIDEIHVLPKELQEKLGLIILDFRYQLNTHTGLKNFYFPRFTVFAATTKPGDLIKPLRTRFANKFNISYLSDEDMVDVVESMISLRGWDLEQEVKILIARASQGIPREAENLLSGLFSCWINALQAGQAISKCVITKDVALKFLKSQEFTEDGLSYRQVKVLKFLKAFVKPKKIMGAGVTRICSFLGADLNCFSDEIEPRLVYRGLITSGSRGRELTEEGLKYLESVDESI